MMTKHTPENNTLVNVSMPIDLCPFLPVGKNPTKRVVVLVSIKASAPAIFTGVKSFRMMNSYARAKLNIPYRVVEMLNTLCNGCDMEPSLLTEHFVKEKPLCFITRYDRSKV
jgi:hypothetical protein